VRPTSLEDTIAAISTPLGEGGIGIVRVSGAKAVDIVRGIFCSPRGRDIKTSRARVFYGEVRDDDGAAIDEVLVHVMRAPHSYTREDVVEINCHGGAGPLNAVLELVLIHGARIAEPGEFTRRAFLNGRIDLVQAEAVIDRIRARTRASLRAAATAASGALSQSIHSLNTVLVDALARIEASVDFPEEDLPDLVNEGLRSRLASARERMRTLLNTAETGRLYREGASVAIAGRPNVGKSSLFNALLRDARAIVTAEPGTTRDRIEEVITIAGVPVRLTDTAGIRSGAGEVEQIGMDVARESFKTADIVLFVCDVSQPLTAEDEQFSTDLRSIETPIILVLNKTDLVDEAARVPWRVDFNAACAVSAATGAGLQELESAIGRLLLGDMSIAPSQEMLTRAHQRDSLRRAAKALDGLLENFGASPEFLSIDLREALGALGEITGETTSEDLLDVIFSSFCIGK